MVFCRLFNSIDAPADAHGRRPSRRPPPEGGEGRRSAPLARVGWKSLGWATQASDDSLVLLGLIVIFGLVRAVDGLVPLLAAEEAFHLGRLAAAARPVDTVLAARH